MRRILTIGAIALIAAAGCAKKQTVKTEEPAAASPQIAEPAKPPDEEKTTQAKIEFRTVYFEFDSYDIRQEDKPLLAEAARLLRGHPQIALRLEGHCDERGTAEYNLALGERRANAVRDYLTGLGVERSRLRTVSFGRERPADAGHEEAAWGRNRRVEFAAEGI